MLPAVYLAGPICGRTYQENCEWREHVARRLPPSIIVASPMRHKEYLRGVGVMTANDDANGRAYSSDSGIMGQDRFDVMNCAVLLANFLGTDVVSKGTVMEVAWADAFRKPIVLCMEDGNIHDHPMIRQASHFITPSLDDAIDIVWNVLSPYLGRERRG